MNICDDKSSLAKTRDKRVCFVRREARVAMYCFMQIIYQFAKRKSSVCISH